MITLEKAYKIAEKELLEKGYEYGIAEILDTGDGRWLFCGQMFADGATVYGGCPLVMDKQTGELKWFPLNDLDNAVKYCNSIGVKPPEVEENPLLLIRQCEFFKGLDFEIHEFNHHGGDIICYKGTDGGFYRVDHFGNSYVIEYAENESEAKINRFEDTNLYNDSLPKNEVIRLVQADLKKFVAK